MTDGARPRAEGARDADETRAAPARTPREAEFDALYTDRPDPWELETSAYERLKYDATLAALPRERYSSALEVGCSIGVLTERLAGRCDRLLALDVSAVPIARAQARLAASPWADRVGFVRAEVPGGWPRGRYDLIVLSEVLYFLEPDEVDAVADACARDLMPGGTVLIVNWLGPCDRTLTGNGAAEAFAARMATRGHRHVPAARTDRFRIDRFNRP